MILLENVWASFLIEPMAMARYIDEIDSPMVDAYFDVGNVVNYGWPEQWIRILGKRILKLDIKDFSRKERNEEGLWKGFGAKIGDGDAGWIADNLTVVDAALAATGDPLDIDRLHGWHRRSRRQHEWTGAVLPPAQPRRVSGA